MTKGSEDRSLTASGRENKALSSTAPGREGPGVLRELLDAFSLATERLLEARRAVSRFEADREHIRRAILMHPNHPEAAAMALVRPEVAEPSSTGERVIGRVPSAAIADVVGVFRGGRAPMTTQQVAMALGISMETASVRLSRAVKDGFIRRRSRGFYEASSV